ncbi:MAG: hypothetical protein WCZ72_10330 [Gemmobacter sp.]
MTRRGWIGAGIALWAVVFFGSLALRWAVPVAGDGFRHVMERTLWMTAGQMLAAGLAVGLWYAARDLGEFDGLRRAARLPLMVALVAAVGIAGGAVLVVATGDGWR